VRTNFRFPIGSVNDDAATNATTGSRSGYCWERLNDSPIEIGYRATATQVAGDIDHVYVLFGADRSRVAVNDVWQYSLLDDSWRRLNDEIAAPDDGAAATPPRRWKHAATALDEHRILITGGRDGNIVHDDAWILDTDDLSWTKVRTKDGSSLSLPPMYRHGTVFDPTRNVAWIYGGLNDNLQRYPSQLWRMDMVNYAVMEVEVNGTSNNPPPPRLASHAMEYVPKADAILMWGGTCSDDSEMHIYDPQENNWCRIYPSNRPDRRDAMIWSLQYPNFYIAQGDSICYDRQVLTLADVHVSNLQQIASLDLSWEMLYEPSNVPRGTGLEPYCDGTNAGSCQPRPLLWVEEEDASFSTCSPELLSRFLNDDSQHSSPTDTTTFKSAAVQPTSSPSQGIADTPQGGGKEEQSRARPSTHASDLLLLSLVMIWVANRIL